MARLRLLGERALGALEAAFPDSDPATRLGILAVLEGSSDGRAAGLVLRALEDADPGVSARAAELAGCLPTAAAAQVLGRLLRVAPPLPRAAALEALLRLHQAGVVEALDGLLGVLLDESAPDELRWPVLEALRAAPGGLPEEVEARLRSTRLSDGRARPLGGGHTLLGRLLEATDPEAARALAGELDEDALPAVHERLAPDLAPLPLRLLVERLAELGQPSSIPRLSELLRGLAGAPETPQRLEARARVHLALSALHSRIALYDLRELLQRQPPVAPELLLRAAEAVGDCSLLPSLAALCTNAPEHAEGCAAAFRAAVAREPAKARRQRPREEHREAWDQLWAGYTPARRQPRHG